MTRRSLKYTWLLLTLCLPWLQTAQAIHPIKLSVMEVTSEKGKLRLRLKLFVDDFDACMTSYTKSTFDLVQFEGKPIDPSTQRKIADYVAERWQIQLNDFPLKIYFKQAYVDQEKIRTDYAVVFVELEAKIPSSAPIHSVGVTNKLLEGCIYEQKNMVNLHFGEQHHVMVFDNEEGVFFKKITF